MQREQSHINKGIHIRIPQMKDSCCDDCLYFRLIIKLVSEIKAVILAPSRCPQLLLHVGDG